MVNGVYPPKSLKALDNQGLLCWGAKLLPHYGSPCWARTNDTAVVKLCLCGGRFRVSNRLLRYPGFLCLASVDDTSRWHQRIFHRD